MKFLVIAVLVAVGLTYVVRGQFGTETFVCDGSDCESASGTKSLLTGVAAVGPIIAALGFLWSDVLLQRNRLGPTAKWAVPDFEQILEVLAVLLAGLASYWLILNGPSIEAVDVRQVNQWANDLRNFRADEFTPDSGLVPAALTWIVIGAILSGPFWFSFGSMIGRETVGRKSRKEASTAALTQRRGSAESSGAGGGHVPDHDDYEIDLDQPGYTIDLDKLESNHRLWD